MIGTKLGSYRIVDEIGSGGMGKVYIAEHELLERRAAVKVLLSRYSDDKAMVERFFNEARAVNQIKHSGIVDVFDFGYTDSARAYILMELLEGESLHDRIKRRRILPEEEVLRLSRQIASALRAAHDAGIIHRDLKPDNVFVVPDVEVPGGERVKVLDFGIAKLTGDTHRSASKTSTGMVLGSPLYMSPEQCAGSGKNVDQRSDIYSLGCVMFHMICGRPPFVGQGGGQIIAQHIYESPKPVSYYYPAVRPEVEQVVMYALAKEPDHRYPSMLELVTALDGVGAVGATSPRQATHSPYLPMDPVPTRGVHDRPGLPTTERVDIGPHPELAAHGAHPRPLQFPGSPESIPGPPSTTFDSVPDYSSPTTLGSVASQVTGPHARKRGRGKLWLAVAILALAGGAAAAAVGWWGESTISSDPSVALQSDSTDIADPDLTPAEPDDTTDVDPTGEPDGTTARGSEPGTNPGADEDTQPAPPDDTEQPDQTGEDSTPAEVENVTFRIDSRPDRALIRDLDGKLLGETPLNVQFPKDGTKVAFRVEKPGFRDEKLVLVADRDRKKRVKLRRGRRSSPGNKGPPNDPTVDRPKDPTENPVEDPTGTGKKGNDRDWGKSTDPFKD